MQDKEQKQAYIEELFNRIPADKKNLFKDEHLDCLSNILDRRFWNKHPLDYRGSIAFWRWKYYFVILGGREKRKLSRGEIELAKTTMALMMALILIIFILITLLTLYLIKSAFGIDLFPSFSTGIWDWFQSVLKLLISYE